MQPKSLLCLAVTGAMMVAATPAFAWSSWGNAPSFYYQNPDGSYPSYSDFIRELKGIPCGIECTRRAEVRWGLIPPPPRHYYHPYERY